MSLTPVKSAPPSLNSVLQSNPGDRISSGKGEVAPVVAILSRQLPLPQAQQLAGQTALVRVVKGGPGNDAELEFAGQNIQVKLPPGRSLTAGEMVTVSFALAGKAEDLSAGNTGGSKKVLDARNLITPLAAEPDDSEAQESPSFVDRLSGSARLIGLLERLGQGNTPQVSTTVMKSLQQLGSDIRAQLATAGSGENSFGQTPESSAANKGASLPASLPPKAERATPQGLQQLTSTSQPQQALAGALARQVSAAVENSGLFYESHLQQWANGQRSTDQIAQEPQARFGQDQVISEKGLSPSAVDQSLKLVTAQLATLDNNRISLALNGLLGQPVQIDIEPADPEPEDRQNEDQGGEPPRPWVAKLKLDMPHLGELHVRVRMIGSRCDVQISGQAQSKPLVDAHWNTFRRAMENQGIQLVHGQFTIPSEGTGEQ